MANDATLREKAKATCLYRKFKGHTEDGSCHVCNRAIEFARQVLEEAAQVAANWRDAKGNGQFEYSVIAAAIRKLKV